MLVELICIRNKFWKIFQYYVLANIYEVWTVLRKNKKSQTFKFKFFNYVNFLITLPTAPVFFLT